MDFETALALDRELREMFAARECEPDFEYGLKRELVLRSHSLLPNYPFVVMHEWEVEEGRSQYGQGDLVFTDGRGQFAVVEVKYLPEHSGRTARTKRTKARKEVRAQARWYASIIAGRKHGHGAVLAFIYTNDRPYGLVEVGRAERCDEE